MICLCVALPKEFGALPRKRNFWRRASRGGDVLSMARYCCYREPLKQGTHRQLSLPRLLISCGLPTAAEIPSQWRYAHLRITIPLIHRCLQCRGQSASRNMAAPSHLLSQLELGEVTFLPINAYSDRTGWGSLRSRA